MKIAAPLEDFVQGRRRWLLALSVIVIVGMLLRGAVLARGFGSLEDPDNYLKLAKSLVEGRGFALRERLTAYRPPLYPIILAPLVGGLGKHLPWGVAVLHILLGGATVVATAWTSRRWGLGPVGSLIAAGIVAADPVLVSQARMVMTETLAAFLVALTLLATTKSGPWGVVYGGVGFGFATLCRPSLLPAAILSALAVVFLGPERLSRRVGLSLLLLLATFAVLMPWALRNARVLGEPVWTTTHGGYTLALANNPVYYDDVLNGPPGAVWSGPNQRRWFMESNRSVAGLGEVEADRRFRAAALRMLADRPSDFLRASVARLGRFWGIAPAGAVYSQRLRVLTTLWTIPLWIALISGCLRRDLWQWPQIIAPLVILALTAVHSVFWTDLRMRAPIVPAIAVIAALGVSKEGVFGRVLERSKTVRKD